MVDLEKELAKAVRHFWNVRAAQQEIQGAKTGRKDAGDRAAVTGGKHGDGFISLISAILRDCGLADAEIFIAKKTLPGYFRPAKNWDLIAKVGDDLVAVVEVKAHVGSFGNNFNNRVEEALGSSQDFWTAYREGTFKLSARPWLGYLMMLEDAPGSMTRSRERQLPHYPLRSEFQSVSYCERYQIFCERLMRERHYDAACFITSDRVGGRKGRFSEPSKQLGIRKFAQSLSARAAAFAKTRNH